MTASLPPGRSISRRRNPHLERRARGFTSIRRAWKTASRMALTEAGRRRNRRLDESTSCPVRTIALRPVVWRSRARSDSRSALAVAPEDRRELALLVRREDVGSASLVGRIHAHVDGASVASRSRARGGRPASTSAEVEQDASARTPLPASCESTTCVVAAQEARLHAAAAAFTGRKTANRRSRSIATIFPSPRGPRRGVASGRRRPNVASTTVSPAARRAARAPRPEDGDVISCVCPLHVRQHLRRSLRSR